MRLHVVITTMLVSHLKPPSLNCMMMFMVYRIQSFKILSTSKVKPTIDIDIIMESVIRAVVSHYALKANCMQ